jgi:uncharacterized protein (DUF2147 family)
MRWLGLFVLVGLMVAPVCVSAQSGGVMGTWREPGGSVIDVERCGTEICLKLVGISATAPTRVDKNNPDEALRGRPLCGLRIGSGFKASDAEHADGGTLYDPKSGKTYHGTLWVEDGRLHLRGYVGFKAFGRTELWQRAAGVELCKA